MLAKCKECGKEYDLKKGERVSDFQCECGGKLRVIPPKPDYDITKKKKEVKLSKCPICQHDLSPNAVTCQNCGNPTGRNVDPIWMVIAIIVPLAGIIAGSYFGVKDRKGGMAVILFSVIGVLVYFGILVYSVTPFR